jgi:hypothetical protein
MASGDRKRSGSVDDGEDMLEGALIYGYLQKLGRNGKWQTRWFETDGECLTYYKSKQRIKLLATLDLAKVGSIVINHEDATGCCFNINISARPYLLRADTSDTCKDWVITLNRVKEARMQEGNVKLFMPDKNRQLPDLLDQNYAPRVVVVSNRIRTRAVDDEQIHSWEAGGWNENPANEGDQFVAPPTSSRLARWQKPRTSISRLAGKLVKWARSLRKHGCLDADSAVQLDHYVHPPGHDDKPKVRFESIKLTSIYRCEKLIEFSFPNYLCSATAQLLQTEGTQLLIPKLDTPNLFQRMLHTPRMLNL